MKNKNTAPNATKRKMPSRKKIREFWVDRLWRDKGFDSPSEFLEPEWCFACGMGGESTLDRAHIQARVNGGDDSLENIHLLCHICHKDSEYLEGEKYTAWFFQRSAADMFMSMGAREGVNLSTFLSLR